MADVFISYKAEDRTSVEGIVAILDRVGKGLGFGLLVSEAVLH